MSSTSLPRRVAAEILIDVLDRKRTLDDALQRASELSRLSASDQSFVRAMVLPTLRQLGRIDAVLSDYLEKPIADAPASARALLRLGAAQSWILKTPDHAVVSESVDTAKDWPQALRTDGFVNAVLRKVVEDHDRFESIPLKANWPQWMWDDLSSQLGEAKALRLLQAQQRQPKLHLSPHKLSADQLAAKLGGETIGLGSVQLDSQKVEQIAGFEDGEWWVQDAAAALPAKLMAPKPGEHIADMCAAPGGKTMQLGASGADVVAIDRSRSRLRRLRQNLKRVGLNAVTVIEADAEQWIPEHLFDKILLDAPCSALGTLRRHPEGAWIKTEDDVSRFSDVQRRLLLSSIEKLKPGGELIYCVCSPRPQEGAAIVEAGVAAGLARKPFDADEVGPFSASITDQGDLLTIPVGDFAHDAFFISRLVRYA